MAGFGPIATIIVNLFKSFCNQLHINVKLALFPCQISARNPSKSFVFEACVTPQMAEPDIL
jgi:hypothetical protein